MPFDGLPEGLVTDLVKLRMALDGVKAGWTQSAFGLPEEDSHCAIGWLLTATEWDTAEATRLALKYLYPVLPERAKNRHERLASIWDYNDGGGHGRIVRLFGDAIKLAEKVGD
jgi:hypothetical protein